MIKTQHILLLLLLVVSSLIFLHSPGTADINYWLGWAKDIEKYGLSQGYAVALKNPQMEYPPYSSFILFLVLKIAHFLKIKVFFVFKASLALFLCLTILVFYKWTRRFYLSLALYSALILNSVALSYIDIYFAPTFILSLWMLERNRLALFTLFFSISVLIKWQPLIIAPFLLIYIFRINTVFDFRKIDIKKLFVSIFIPFLLVSLFTIGFFGMPALEALRRALSGILTLLSGYALNINWMLSYCLQLFSPEKFGYLNRGHTELVYTVETKLTFIQPLIFYAGFAGSLYHFFKREKNIKNLMIFSSIGYITYFLFNLTVFENHLFLVNILFAILYWKEKDHLPTFIFWAISSNINLFVFFGYVGKGLTFSRVVGMDLTVILSAINLIYYSVFYYQSAFQKKTELQQIC